MTARSVTVERLFPSGGYMVSAIIGGYLVTRKYFGYTKREAIQLFREETKST